jgi:hypothetical protein
MEPFVTLIEVRMLMYFMQEAGDPLRLNYIKHHYGPYADDPQPVLARIEGHLVSGYAEGGDAPDKQIELVTGAVRDTNALLNDKQETISRLDRVGKLVEGFETPFGLELLATVHWVAIRENAIDADDAAAKVYAWNERKKRFSSRQIGIAFETLRAHGWLAAA